MLAKDPIRVGAGGIEVAKHQRSQAIGALEVRQRIPLGRIQRKAVLFRMPRDPFADVLARAGEAEMAEPAVLGLSVVQWRGERCGRRVVPGAQRLSVR